MKNLFPFILFLAILCCKENESPVVEKEFDYKAYLLRNNDDVIELEVSNLNPEPIIRQLKDSLNTDCLYGLKFNSITKYGVINSMATNFCEHTPTCNRGFGISLILNRHNEILFDEELISIETLKTLDFTEFLNRFGKKDFYLSIYQDRYANPKVVDAVIESIIASYIRYAEEMSMNNFHQPLKNLKTTELDSLKKISAFHLFFEEEVLSLPASPVPNLKGVL